MTERNAASYGHYGMHSVPQAGLVPLFLGTSPQCNNGGMQAPLSLGSVEARRGNVSETPPVLSISQEQQHAELWGKTDDGSG